MKTQGITLLLLVALAALCLSTVRGFESEEVADSRELGRSSGSRGSSRGSSRGRQGRKKKKKRSFSKNCTDIELTTEQEERCDTKLSSILNRSSVSECLAELEAAETDEDSNTFCEPEKGTKSCEYILKRAAMRAGRSMCSCSDDVAEFKETVMGVCDSDDEDDAVLRILRGSKRKSRKGKKKGSKLNKYCNSTVLTDDEVETCSTLVETQLADETVAACALALESLETDDEAEEFCTSDDSTSCVSVLKEARKTLVAADCGCSDGVTELRSSLKGVCGAFKMRALAEVEQQA